METPPRIVSIVAVSAQSIYSIGALARMLGLSPATLRSWEERYGVVVPERSAGSQRLYSRDHLDQLRFVCRQMEQGLSAADAHRALAARLSGNPKPVRSAIWTRGNGAKIPSSQIVVPV